ncbi:response regulator [Desulfuribacillus alkaliarsenatis]|uniref:Uncharacterized protein n=1 Tax=Desulfuribacillus alkaliarsenatis TaxID=766136 RepID=A0A1E5G0Y9_9FIRM|nr:response regulator [Desulfuribacillus alkaliarsenatis]OEF96575.1 hypothetical protein BHF68_07980 [Desulfuribacillus alkaliarsenatis]
MLQTIIIDDEELSCARLERLLAATNKVEIAGVFSLPQQLLELLQQGENNNGLNQVNVAFVDIEMPGLNGLQLVQCLKQKIPQVEVVFVTGYRDYAVEAFEVEALDYVLKPFTKLDVERVLRKITDKINLQSAKLKYATPELIECPLRVRTLGSFIVLSGYSPTKAVKFPTAKVEELFAYLLVQEGKPVGKWELCELLWSDMPPKNAKSNLYTSIYRMKKTIESEKLPFQISSDQHSCYLEFDLTQQLVDYQQLNSFVKTDATVNEQTLTSFETMEALFEGSLFSDRYYLWDAGLREQINENYQILADKLLHYYISKGEDTQTIRLLKKKIRWFPHEERYYRLLVDIYAKLNDRASIVKLLRQYEKTMVEELDLLPSEVMIQLFIKYVYK